MLYWLKKIIKKVLPVFALNIYHYFWAFFSALICGFPSRKIRVVAITGTKGKTTVVEIINAILEKAGFKTALVSSLRFKIGEKSFQNTLKMTMPGRGKIQRFIKQAVAQKCDWLILEATSEGIKQFRHKFIDLDAVIFTNLSPEHIESHGSFEKYKEAKGKLFATGSRKKKIHIINIDDENAEYFLSFKAERKIGYGMKLKVESYKVESYKVNERFQVSCCEFQDSGVDFEIDGQNFHSPLLGEFNLYNILAAIAFTRSLNIDPFGFALFESEPQSRGQGQSRACRGIDWKIIKEAIAEFKGIKGRMQFIDEGQPFKVVIDYAHTPDSLIKIYQTIGNSKFQIPNSKLICVLGAAGGGRDKWKRPEMGKIAAEYCDEIILTNEDSYDENPTEILNQISEGIRVNPRFDPRKSASIFDRREAIKKALSLAQNGDVVIITGKGSESWIAEKNGKKIPWDEEATVRECLQKAK